MKPAPVAVLCSDLHLSLYAPVARSAEPDWLAAQKRQLTQLSRTANKLAVPILCAGDIFHHWKAQPELINFALLNLPAMYAVPGQHDLPLHNFDDIQKSAFGTLLIAEKIKLLQPAMPTYIKGARVWGFPWGFPINPPDADASSSALNVAVVHAYIWQHKSGFIGAKPIDHVDEWSRKMGGYDIALFGDNHKPFIRFPSAGSNSCLIFNHGAFQRRASDEFDHTPALGILMSDGTVKLEKLDCSKDLFIDRNDPKFEEDSQFTMDAFLKELETLGEDDQLSFEQALHHYLKTHEVTPGAEKIILEVTNQ